MGNQNNLSTEQHEEVDMMEVVNERFASGVGVLQLKADMPDELILMNIKQALKASKGKSFTVISC